MRALLGVELLRLRWRRAVLLLAAAAVVVPALVVGAVVIGTRPVSQDDLDAAQAQVDEQVASGAYDQVLTRCERRPGQFGVGGASGDDATRAACEQAVLPTVDTYVYRSPLVLTEQREQGAGFVVAVLLALLAVLVGATFAGHDWNTGSMSNQLLFESRRTRIWLAKAGALAVATAALSLVVLAACWSVLWAFAAVRDDPIAHLAVRAGYEQAVLGAFLAGGAAVAAYGLTMLFRSTVATLGVLLAVAVGSTVLFAVVGLDTHPRVLPDANVQAYLVGSATRTDYDGPACSSFNGHVVDACVRTIDRSDSVLYLGVLLAIVVVLSVLSFRRRDLP